MNFQINTLKPWLTLPFLLGVISLPPGEILQAHETEVDGKIAATWHLEPNDAPEAGKPAQIWIALTGSGGNVIPLSECDCTLKIWSVPQGTEPLLEPDLKSIAAEQYTGIPGADVVFPDRGQYLLELSGTPKAGANFSPFRFQNQILVATGAATPNPAPNPSASPSTIATEPGSTPVLNPTLKRSSLISLIIGLSLTSVMGIGLWGLITLKNRQNGKKSED